MSRKSRDLFCIFAMTRQIQKISLVYFKLHKPAITTWTKIRIIFQNEDSVKMCAAASLSSHHSALCSYFVNSRAQIIYFQTFSGNRNASNWWGDKNRKNSRLDSFCRSLPLLQTKTYNWALCYNVLANKKVSQALK